MLIKIKFSFLTKRSTFTLLIYFKYKVVRFVFGNIFNVTIIGVLIQIIIPCRMHTLKLRNLLREKAFCKCQSLISFLSQFSFSCYVNRCFFFVISFNVVFFCCFFMMTIFFSSTTTTVFYNFANKSTHGI